MEAYDGGRWNAQIWIPERAEAVLGPDRFARLGDRIGRLKGVGDLAWEDREVMLVRISSDVEPEDLRRRVAAVLRRARQAAEADAEPPGT
ncbi:MAG: hypothetical protein ACRDHD_04475 [Candidatus Limnocylindria bacterium]